MTQLLTDKILANHKRFIARLITRLENNHPTVQAELNALYPHTGQAHLVGVTGAPGTGKSSLVNELAKAYRQQAKRVAILAVDPTSPFSGGAVLGDRIRMQDLSGDAGVFIRSMATRGSLGGLAVAVNDTLKVLDAAGYEVILIETVGAGQSEVDIVRTAHTVIVVEAPGLGDDVQAIKAGILEIADIFLVNKADRDGVNRTVSSLKRMLELGNLYQQTDDPVPWSIPIIKTVAIKSEGIDEAVKAIQTHHGHLKATGHLVIRNKERLHNELTMLLQTELMARLYQKISPETLSQIIDQIAQRDLSPHQAIQKILG